MKLSKIRVAQVVVLFVIVVFAVRESRILWNVEGLEIFDLAYWGINISDAVYTAQNLFMFWGGIIVLILLRRWESPEVLSEHAPAREKKTPKSSSPRRRKERDKAPDDESEKNPFTMVNNQWRKVEFKEDTYP